MKPWWERLAQWGARGEPLAQDKADACDWGTCPVGEHHAAQPTVVRYDAYCLNLPVDAILLNLGSQFSGAVCRNNLERADALLDAIDDRVLTLKREAGV